MNLNDMIVVGCEEWCSFPSLSIPAIKARVDSGAKTSSVHAVNIQPFKRNNEPWVSFEMHPLQGSRKVSVRCEAQVADRRVIKSSSGDTEKRYENYFENYFVCTMFVVLVNEPHPPTLYGRCPTRK